MFTSYAVPLYVGWRIWWANRLPLMDCDEVYNYWEPLHFLLFGTGFQTWEYANEYALRTYAYLTPLCGLAKVYLGLIPHLPAWWWPLLTSQPVVVDVDVDVVLANNNKVALFVLLRAALAAGMALAELSFCRAIYEQSQNNQTPSPHQKSNGSDYNYYAISLVTAGLLVSSAGMSHASGALLPSSTLTMLWLLGAAAYMRQQHVMFATFAITATLAIGWPFGVLLFVPLGVAVLVRELSSRSSRLFGRFVLKIITITAVIQGLVMMVDQRQYGRWVSPTWNIIMYNTKSGGDELYGIEPWTYYVKNLALNFNYVLVGVAVLPILLWKQLLQRKDTKDKDPLMIVVLLPMYVWLAVVAPRPHKEERFLFPIYPCLCLGAAVLSVTLVDSIMQVMFQKETPLSRRSPTQSLIVQGILWAPAALLSLARTWALSKYYTAPLYVYAQFQSLPDMVVDAKICTCGEWYRFPSSFYLPTTTRLQSTSFGFLPSSFQGQLPQPFAPQGSGPNTASTVTFNDQNKPEPGAYLQSIDECDYLIDLWTSSECRENDSIWRPIAQGSFLDAERTTTLHRILYVPYLHEQEGMQGGEVQYIDYVLYQKQDEEEQHQQQQQEGPPIA
jgi:alpha-1,2-mannosyltransferase